MLIFPRSIIDYPQFIFQIKIKKKTNSFWMSVDAGQRKEKILYHYLKVTLVTAHQQNLILTYSFEMLSIFM